MPGTKIAAGNFLLSFAVLAAGASATKVRTVFTLMGLACISLQTYHAHRRLMIIDSDSFSTWINLVCERHRRVLRVMITGSKIFNGIRGGSTLVLAVLERHSDFQALTNFECQVSEVHN